MQQAMERKSSRSIQLSQNNLDESNKSTFYEIWDKNDGLDSPMSPKIKLPGDYQPKFIHSVRNQSKRGSEIN
ncbi:unnamed protein product (macronuclear) [Paramecium tetraurelia]|uniref:Uncharacterized protein n=1 Tax=Paramecium tetraurelia TaxID=5888 RepID=A0E723_PARTE|nr:uncharacterized protein GSPATT00023818001 [Paramecium tetraurelia]CAK91090.1 unnamed protein product [Paramecium tetraurelia]|eukprot:XP_001458487.1 hypothetical protein (macronuclear) [Paramecium tetraurelia strain d4-2]